MESVQSRQLRILLVVFRALIIFLIILGLVFVGGTIYALLFHTTSQEDSPVNLSQESGEGQIFTGIGRIRIPTTDPQPGMVVIFALFVYYPNDKAFTEELVLRTGDFRHIIVDYLGSFSVAELQKLAEEDIKAEMLRRFNAILRLGQIETLYFSDFMIIG